MSVKLSRFHALALVHGRPTRKDVAIAHDGASILWSRLSRRMRASINRVCTQEELGGWGGIEKFAYDYAFWYRREEQRMGRRR